MAETEMLSVQVPAAVMTRARDAAREVSDGPNLSDSELVAHALLDWSYRLEMSEADVERVREAVREADEMGGPYVPMDEVFDRLEAKFRKLAKESTEG